MSNFYTFVRDHYDKMYRATDPKERCILPSPFAIGKERSQRWYEMTDSEETICRCIAITLGAIGYYFRRLVRHHIDPLLFRNKCERLTFTALEDAKRLHSASRAALMDVCRAYFPLHQLIFSYYSKQI